MSPLLWPLVVVACQVVLFSLTVFLVRRFSHEHDEDTQSQTQSEVPAERTPAEA
jgi:hypothetical protein